MPFLLSTASPTAPTRGAGCARARRCRPRRPRSTSAASAPPRGCDRPRPTRAVGRDGRRRRRGLTQRAAGAKSSSPATRSPACRDPRAQPPSYRWPGSSIAPAGLDMARWFGAIEGERLLRLLELSPLPVPEFLVQEVVGRVYSNLAFSSPARATSEAISSFAAHIPAVSPARRSSRSAVACCPSCATRRPRADPMSAAARLGRTRPDGLYDRGRTRASHRAVLGHRDHSRSRALPPGRGTGTDRSYAARLPRRIRASARLASARPERPDLT